MDIQIKKEGYWSEHPAVSLLVVAVIIFLIRIFLRDQVLLLDEAEQVIVAQKLLPGYPAQPPLYTWLQYFFFELFGINLFSLALLKSLLIFGCLYFYYLICRIHCENNVLAWCAVISWALIPPIGLDLIKDNTHSILVLFAACLTWYWLIVAEHWSKLLWYCCFGGILGIGLLSKFNYLLFLSILFLSSLTIPEFRRQFLSPYIILSLVIMAIITSPFFSWLLINQNLGLSSLHKLNTATSFFLEGPLRLATVTLLFVAPVLVVLILLFPRAKNRNSQHKKTNKLLFRYHAFSLPTLAVIILIADFHNFRGRWLVPILFLCPVFYLSQLKYGVKLKSRVISLVSLCAITQFIFFAILIYNSYSKHTKQKQFPLNQIIELAKANSAQVDYIVSDSYWLLGNLAIALPTKNIWMIRPSELLLPKGRSLILWKGTQLPFWVELFTNTYYVTELNLLLNVETKAAVGGQAFAYRPSVELTPTGFLYTTSEIRGLR